MTYYAKQETRPEIGEFYGFHHVRFYVSNSKQAASFYTSRFGFSPVAYEGLETGNQKFCTNVVRSNHVVIAFTSALTPEDNEVNRHVGKHSDGVQDIAFSVSDARGMYEKAIAKGCKSFREPQVLQDQFGSVIIASLQTYGDTVHTLVQNVDYTGPFLPGFRAITKDDPLNSAFPQVNYDIIDHVVGNQPGGDMTPTVEWYEKYLEFHRYWSADESVIHTDYSALRSVVVADWDEVIKMPINEPADGLRKSQIQEYVEYYGGAGVQHIALKVNDIISVISTLRARGVEFLEVPPKYYDNLRKRLAHSTVQIEEDLRRIEDLHILVDFDDQGYLLQIFTKPVEDRPTLFYEIIQRHNNNGFGIGNFKALFESLEQEQERRGNLV
ncbi:unnamed protein product [Blepharisma stoltei]|uniref:4-hydroxyphenylpyruvate dioxygenase n=1 Tax=Blepharisma stoltei TaxID=1481888 RepID=A0AAU9IVR7_9CILI|nr:unnamed protein product [Blepharisma stoltei]